MNTKQGTQKALLLILDGWGLSTALEGNAIAQAKLQHWPRLLQEYPNTGLHAAGPPVGLPEGQAGNSELGHLTLGAGQPVLPPGSAVSNHLQADELLSNARFNQMLQQVKQRNSTLHLVGLLSDAGVHSYQHHLLALLEACHEAGLPSVRVHAFTDGRDTEPDTAELFVRRIEEVLLDYDYPQITTIGGRFYGMDRDNRWERTQAAFEAIAYGQAQRQFLSLQALRFFKEAEPEKTEEFLPPSNCDLTYEGLQANDAVFFFNFRGDRLRQLAQAFALPNFSAFERNPLPEGLSMATWFEGLSGVPLPGLFQSALPDASLADALAEAGLRQLRVAESEKAAHVTYFFNGQRKEPVVGERRCIVPSPAVETYDQQPAMSIAAVSEAIIEGLRDANVDVVIANIANGDMIGHTGNWQAALEAARHVDNALAQIEAAVLEQNAIAFITADHGNIEAMLTSEGRPNPAHTLNPVPFVVVGQPALLQRFGFTTEALPKEASLCHVAPSLLAILGLKPPAEMEEPWLAPSAMAAV